MNKTNRLDLFFHLVYTSYILFILRFHQGALIFIVSLPYDVWERFRSNCHVTIIAISSYIILINLSCGTLVTLFFVTVDQHNYDK